MTTMTTGQRIAGLRKEQGLSQEALGAELGVSRQAIYKWESDTALPEIEKLVALARRFGVSVGWLLGVEEAETPPCAAGEPAAQPGELTPAQLEMVEEIVKRYTAALPRPRKTPRGLRAAALVVALGLCLRFAGQLSRLENGYKNLQSSLYNVQTSLNGQINSLTGRIEATLEKQNALVAEYSVEIASAAAAQGRLTFAVRAVPKKYTEGMTAVFTARAGGEAPVQVQAQTDPAGGTAFTGTVSCAMADDIAVSVDFLYPDGTRETQVLERFSGFYSGTLPELYVEDYALLNPDSVSADGTVHWDVLYITLSDERGAAAPAQYQGAERAEMQTAQVGLFVDRTLVAWAEPCDIPRGFSGFEEGRFAFYCLKDVTVRLEPGQQIAAAAIVTDSFGRELVYQSNPAVREGEALTWPEEVELSSDPSEWIY